MHCAHWKRTSLTLLTLTWLTFSSCNASTLSCVEEPTARCLVLMAIERWPHIQIDDPSRKALAAELAFEAPFVQANFSTSIQPANPTEHDTTRQLQQEEVFLHALRQHNFKQAQQQLMQLPATMQDYLHSPPSALYIEAQTLALQDTEADKFKKNYYESLLNLDATTRTLRMIAVARHEILGGQPAKGLHTLENADIDEFSESEFFLSRHATEMLATHSEQLFLRPDQVNGNCSTPDTIGALLQQYIQNGIFQRAINTQEIPDTRIRVEFSVLLARLHHNSAQCVLLEKWLSAQAVTQAILPSPNTAAELIQTVQLARAIRRYTN